MKTLPAHWRWLVERSCREGGEPDVAASCRGGAVVVDGPAEHDGDRRVAGDDG